MKAVTQLLTPAELLQPQEFEGHPDPHVWMDPQLWIRAAEVIRDELAKMDPQGAEAYARAAEAYIAKLRSLDEEMKLEVDAGRLLSPALRA